MMKRYRLQRVGTQMAGGPDTDPTSWNFLGCNNACCTAYYVAILSVNLSHVFPLGLGAQSVPRTPLRQKRTLVWSICKEARHR